MPYAAILSHRPLCIPESQRQISVYKFIAFELHQMSGGKKDLPLNCVRNLSQSCRSSCISFVIRIKWNGLEMPTVRSISRLRNTLPGMITAQAKFSMPSIDKRFLSVSFGFWLHVCMSSWHFFNLSRGSLTSMQMLSVSPPTTVIVVFGTSFFFFFLCWCYRNLNFIAKLDELMKLFLSLTVWSADHKQVVCEMNHVCNAKMMNCYPVKCCTQLFKNTAWWVKAHVKPMVGKWFDIVQRPPQMWCHHRWMHQVAEISAISYILQAPLSFLGVWLPRRDVANIWKGGVPKGPAMHPNFYFFGYLFLHHFWKFESWF